MSLTKDEKKMLQEIRDSQIETRAVLLGVNGQPGLCDEVSALARGHGKLKRNFWILVGMLIGSGIVGSGITMLNGV